MILFLLISETFHSNFQRNQSDHIILPKRDGGMSEETQKLIFKIHQLEETIASYQAQDANITNETIITENSITETTSLIDYKNEEAKALEALIEKKKEEQKKQTQKAVEIVNQQLSYTLIRQVILHSIK